jgi:tetratricopeptide (TPR) repeat protein
MLLFGASFHDIKGEHISERENNKQSSSMLSEPPLVGRDEELDRLSAILKRITKGSGGLLLISGEAGIGKTRLATEFEIKAQRSGCRLLIGGCLPSAQIPYLVFLDALNDLFESASEKRKSRTSKIAGAAKKATPELLKAIPLVGGVMKASVALLSEYSESGKGVKLTKEHVLFKVLKMLKEESEKSPLILHLDDLQWADSASIGMLHFLSRNIRDIPILLLGTYRTEEVAADGAGACHPFLESLRILRRENLLIDEISLKPLEEKQLNNIVTEMLQGPVHEQVLEHIFKESGGSPLFATETVRLLVSSGALVLKDQRYNIAGDVKVTIPSSVKEVIQRRIERTSKDERKVLDYAAVLGLNISPELLSGALRMDQLKVLETLERLENNHHLVRETEIGYSFSHEKVQRFTYETISQLRRRELHKVIGGLIEKQLPNEVLFPQLAHHFYHAMENEKAMRYAYESGKFFFKNHAINEAIPQYKRALELGANIKSFEEYRLPTLEGLGDAYEFAGDALSASKYYEEMLDHDIAGISRVRTLRKLAFCWAPSRLGNGDKEKALQFCSMTQSMPEMDAFEEGEILSLLKGIASFEGNWEESKRLGKEAVDRFKKAGNEEEVCAQLIYNIGAYLTTYDLDSALKELNEAEEINKRLQDIFLKEEWSLHMSYVCLSTGRLKETIHHLDEALDIAKKLGVDSILSIIYFYKSFVTSLLEDNESALLFAERSREVAQRINRDALLVAAYGVLTHAYYRLGRLEECRKFASESMRIVESFGGKIFGVQIGFGVIAGAEAAMSSNDWTTAKKRYHEAINIFESSTLLGKIMQAEAMIWFSEALANHSSREEAKQQIERALLIFKRLGNQPRIEKCQQELLKYSI